MQHCIRQSVRVTIQKSKVVMKIANLAKVRKTAKNGGELRLLISIEYERSYKNEGGKKR